MDTRHYIPVWVSGEQGQTSILGRYVSESAGLHDPEFQLASQAENPDIAYNLTQTGFLLVFDHEYAPGNRDVWGEILYGDNRGRTTFQIYSASYWDKDEFQAKVPYNEDLEQYLVIWQNQWSGNDRSPDPS